MDATGMRFGLVVSRFNSFITERLLAGALDALRRSGARDAELTIVRVPGAFEIPAAARALAESGRVDAVICLGCLIRGETTHYEHIATECTRGIGQSAQETGIPHAYGVLTCENLEQAIDRAGLKAGNKGFEAAMAAIEMASLKKQVAAEKR
ncbi:MAG: 6,7-dimethyl-8-ribityllumazine synthase [Terriglobales bacterium]